MTSKKKRRTHEGRGITIRELKTLGQELISSRSHINNLPRLLSYVKPDSPPQYALESLISLQSFFTPLLPELLSSKLKKKQKQEENAAATAAEFIYLTWLRSKFDDFLQSLFCISSSSHCDQSLREVVLDTIMEFVKIGNARKFHSSIYHRFLLHTIVHSALKAGDILLELLASKYFKYIDVSYFTYNSLEKMARTLETEDLPDDKNENPKASFGVQARASMEVSVQKMYNLLSLIPPLEGSHEESNYEMWNGVGFTSKANKKNLDELLNTEDGRLKSRIPDDKDFSAASVAKKMKLKFSKAWISFLRLPLPIDAYKEVLATLHQTVIPHLSNPIMLCDFLTRSYDVGGVVSVMALSSLYLLMTQHGLEYPNFYEKLYALLEPSIFMAKYRAKFFQLIDSCLKSALLPGYLAAAFCKRLSRLALSVPPSGALVIIALVHNLLRRHPSINFLVHQGNFDETAKETLGTEKGGVDSRADVYSGNKRGIDQFNDEQGDPIKTNAMRSSLWEIDTLRHHYCPPVSRFVLSLENDLTVRAKTTEVAVKDFSSASYATIFGGEIRRRVKQVPLAFYKGTLTSLFSESDFPGWTFYSNVEEPVAANDVNGAVNTCKENDLVLKKRQRHECA